MLHIARKNILFVKIYIACKSLVLILKRTLYLDLTQLSLKLFQALIIIFTSAVHVIVR